MWGKGGEDGALSPEAAMAILVSGNGDIHGIIGGIAPNWGPFGALGQEARVLVEVIMATSLLICLGIAPRWWAWTHRDQSRRRTRTVQAATGASRGRRSMVASTMRAPRGDLGQGPVSVRWALRGAAMTRIKALLG
jgi:hypothetical protein